MTLLMRDKENIEKGITEERVRMVKSLLQMGTIPEKSIAFAAKMSLEEATTNKKESKKRQLTYANIFLNNEAVKFLTQ